MVSLVYHRRLPPFPDLRCCTVDPLFDCALAPDDDATAVFFIAGAAAVALISSSPVKSAEILFKRCPVNQRRTYIE